MSELECLLASMDRMERAMFDALCKDIFHREPDARRAALAHRVAKRLVRAMYEGYELDRRAKP